MIGEIPVLRHLFVLGSLSLLACSSWAELPEGFRAWQTRDFYAKAADQDFSSLWRHDRQGQESFDDDGRIVRRVLNIPPNETWGFCGRDFRRFYVRYEHIRKSARDPYLYLVRGKARIDGQLSRIEGFLRVKQATIFQYSIHGHRPNMNAALPLPGEWPFEYGEVEAEIMLNARRGQIPYGAYIGTLRSSFHLVGGVMYLVTRGEDGGYPGHANDHLTTWTSSDGTQHETCNWTQSDWVPGGEALLRRGDDRSTYLRDEYFRGDWKSFGITRGSSHEPSSDELEQATRVEASQWWLR